MAMAVVQGGSGPHLFSLSVFNYLCSMDLSDLIVSTDEVPKSLEKVLSLIKKVL